MIKQKFCSILTTLLLALTTAAYAKPAPYTVIVIGAGIAGLSAAHTLHKHHISTLVLEARDRIGGRIQTVRPWGKALDLGASWIHGISHNPITNIAKQLHLKTVSTLYNDNDLFAKFHSFTLYDEQGKPIAATELTALIDVANHFFTLMQRKHTHDTLEIALNQFMETVNLPPLQHAILRHMIINACLNEYAADMDALPANIESNYADTKVSGANVIFVEGYSQILPSIANRLHLHLNEPVNKIKYDKHGADVYTNKHHYHSNYVIVTVPLGVLKASKIKFIPALPKHKQQAIHDLNMGVYNKIYLHFDHVFWDKKPEWIGQIPPANNENNMWDILNFSKFNHAPDLLIFTAGRFATQIENLSDQQTIVAAMNALRKIYGRHIPDPTGYTITRWQHDPYSYGSYSYNPPGTNATTRQTLADSVAGTLFFAGEATSITDPATVHGAYLSGLRVANEIELLLTSRT